MHRLLIAIAGFIAFATTATAQISAPSAGISGLVDQPRRWTTSTRPESPVPGQFGYNSDLGAIEFWTGSVWTLSPNQLGLGYQSGRFYSVGAATAAVGTAYGPSLDTQMALYPFTVQDSPLTAVSLNVRTVTGVASCSIKMALYANNPATSRPTGVPIAGSNTGQSCASSTTTQSVTISPSVVLIPGQIYWAAVAVSTGASTFVSLSIAGTVQVGAFSMFGQMGSASVTSAFVVGWLTSYTFASNILTTDLTGATFAAPAVGGIPLMYIGT